MRALIRGSRFATAKPICDQIFVNGQFVKSKGKPISVLNPATEKQIAQIPDATKDEVDQAVTSARNCFESKEWKKTSGAQRAELLRKLADLVDRDAAEIATLETIDSGFDLVFISNVLRYYAGFADKLEGKSLNLGENLFGYTRNVPVGVVGTITAWNFPLMLQSWKIGPAIAAGCTMVLKPAEDTSLTALKLGQLLQEAGFPDGAINIVTGYGKSVGNQLVEHPLIDKIAFTGSTEVGRDIIAKSSRPNIKRVTMELGGKSPLIVLPDANIDLAVQQAHIGNFINNGQVCCNPTRVYVHKSMYDQFIEKSVLAAEAKPVGDPLDEKTEQGPQVNKKQMERILNYIKAGKDQGAQLCTGGQRLDREGYFIQPTIFSNVKEDMKIAREEIFGPVMNVIQYDSEEDLIHKANDTMYGLAATIVTSSYNKGIKLADQIKAGSVYVNSYVTLNQYTPFGGFKDSGYGRELGYAGIKGYLETKTVILGL